MTQKARSKGFSLLAVIVVVLVIAAVGVGGWVVWRENNSIKEQAPVKQEGTHKNVSAEEDKYLAIKEWGVQFELPKELRNDLLTYVSNTDASGTALFASKRVNALAGGGDCDIIRRSNGSYSGGLETDLVRINPDTYPKDKFELYKQGLIYIKKVGDYDYYRSKPADLTCATAVGGKDPVPGLYDLEQKTSKQLEEALETLQPVD